MIKNEYTEQDIEQLHYERFHHPDPQVHKRMEVVYLDAWGHSRQETEKITRLILEDTRNMMIHCMGVVGKGYGSPYVR